MDKGIIGYSEEVKEVQIGDKVMTIINRTPIFRTEADREKVRREIESRLYDVFIKYQDKNNDK